MTEVDENQNVAEMIHDSGSKLIKIPQDLDVTNTPHLIDRGRKDNRLKARVLPKRTVLSAG